MPYIRVDATVLAYLREQRRGYDTANDTVRTLLGLPALPSRAVRAPATAGELLPLLTAGALCPGQTLTWTRRNLRQVHTATVDEAGRMVLADGASFRSPDSCASAIAGYPHKGWRCWRTGAGESLQQLRDRTAPPAGT